MMLAQGAVVIANLLITPLLIRGLGKAGYALYTLIWTLLGYLMLLTCGTSNAVQKFGAQYVGREKEFPIGWLLRKTLVFQTAAVLAGACVLALFRHHIIGAVAKTPAELVAAAWVFTGVLASVPIYAALQFSVNVLYATQRFKLYNAFQTAQSLIVALVAALILRGGGGLHAIVWAFALAQALLAGAGLYLVRADLAVRRLPQKSDVRQYVSFALKSFPTHILWIVIDQGDKLVIGKLLTLSQLAYYVVSSSITDKLNTLLLSVTATSQPIQMQVHGRGEAERARRFYLKATEFSLWIVLPVTILAFILVPQFMSFWISSEFSDACTWPFRGLVLANLIYSFSLMPANVVVALGRPEIITYVLSCRAGLMILGWALLIPRFGILGAAGSSLLAELVVNFSFVWYVHARYLRVSWRDFWSQSCYRPAVTGMSLAILAILLQPHIGSWMGLASLGVFGAAIFWGAAYFLLDSEAKKLLAGWVLSKLTIST